MGKPQRLDERQSATKAAPIFRTDRGKMESPCLPPLPKCFKDTLRFNLKALAVQTSSWKHILLDRPIWSKNLHKGAY